MSSDKKREGESGKTGKSTTERGDATKKRCQKKDVWTKGPDTGTKKSFGAKKEEKRAGPVEPFVSERNECRRGETENEKGERNKKWREKKNGKQEPQDNGRQAPVYLKKSAKKKGRKGGGGRKKVSRSVNGETLPDRTHLERVKFDQGRGRTKRKNEPLKKALQMDRGQTPVQENEV